MTSSAAHALRRDFTVERKYLVSNNNDDNDNHNNNSRQTLLNLLAFSYDGSYIIVIFTVFNSKPFPCMLSMFLSLKHIWNLFYDLRDSECGNFVDYLHFGFLLSLWLLYRNKSATSCHHASSNSPISVWYHIILCFSCFSYFPPNIHSCSCYLCVHVESCSLRIFFLAEVERFFNKTCCRKCLEWICCCPSLG